MNLSENQLVSGAAPTPQSRDEKMAKTPIWIGNDHGGYELKLKLQDYLRSLDMAYHDVGSHSTEIVRYPCFAAQVAGSVASGAAARGILICSTGIGMSIIANKFKGVRASVCTSRYMGKMTRAHNDSNILCLGGKITGELEAIEIVKNWLHTEYLGGRHCISLGLIAEAEAVLSTGAIWQPVGAMK
jgi:ribose 5-phosphate isomerase B